MAAAPYVTCEVMFPRELEAAQANRFFAGLVATRGRPFLLSTPATVILEVIGSAGQIRYFIHSRPVVAPAVWGALRGAIAHVGLRETDPPCFQWRRAVELYGGVEQPPEFIDPGQIPTLLGALAGLDLSEAISLQLLVDPITPGTAEEPEALFSAIGRVAAQADDNARVEAMIGRLLVVYNSLHPFEAAEIPKRWLSTVNERGRQGFSGSSFFRTSALAVLAGLPIGSPAVPGLRLGRVKRLEPDYAIPSIGRQLLVSNYPGNQRPLALSTDDRLRHVYLVGPTGTGKSTVMERSAIEDMNDGFGVLFIDPKGDRIARILDRIPRWRLDRGDVIVLDLAGSSRPVGFNLLVGDDPYLVADEVCSVLEKLLGFSSDTVPRATPYLRSAVLTLTMLRLSLCELPPILRATPIGYRFRQRVVRDLTDRELRQFWLDYDGHTTRDQADIAAPILNRLDPLLRYPQLRASFGQLATGFDMEQVLTENKILLVPMGGRISQKLASLVGSLVLTQFWQAARHRADGYDRPFFVYLDEFAQCLNLPMSFREMCDQARGFGIGLNLAHTVASELPADIRRSVFGNIRTKLVFQTTSRDDGVILAGELGEPVTAEDIGQLGMGEVIARVMAGGSVSPPVTGHTLRELEPTGLGQLARTQSEAKYGRPLAEVQAELDARHGYTDPDERAAELRMPTSWDDE